MPKGVYKRRGKRYHRPDCKCASCESKRGNAPITGKHHSEETLEKMRGPRAPFTKEHKQKLRVPKSDLHKEATRLQRWGILSPGPGWFRTVNDFVLLACEMYNLQYEVAHRRIMKVLEEKGLSNLDLLLFINFASAGHNRIELAEHYNISEQEVVKRLRNFELQFPGAFQTQISARDGQAIGFLEWMEYIAKYQF